MSNYIVTGGAGFIGSHIVEELIRRKQPVKVLDNFSTGKKANLESFGRGLEIITVDLSQPADLVGMFAGVDYVIHQAAIPSVPKSILDPLASHNASVNATLNVLIAARDAGVKRVVYASSSSLYGDSPTLPKHELMLPRPLSPYGAQKLFGEIYCQVFSRTYGLETAALRYFNVFGPRQDPTSQYSGVLAKFIPTVLQDRQPVIYGDGLQSRDFTYVQNVVEANLLACTAPGVGGEEFNIACGDRITVNDMLEQIKQITGKNPATIYEAARGGDIKHSQADVSKARKMLNYNPSVTFEEGLKRTVAWYAQSIGVTV